MRNILAYKINPSSFVLYSNEVLKGFNKIGFNFIPRFSNVAAHYLVELGLVSVDDNFFFFSFGLEFGLWTSHPQPDWVKNQDNLVPLVLYNKIYYSCSFCMLTISQLPSPRI